MIFIYLCGAIYIAMGDNSCVIRILLKIQNFFFQKSKTIDNLNYFHKNYFSELLGVANDVTRC